MTPSPGKRPSVYGRASNLGSNIQTEKGVVLLAGRTRDLVGFQSCELGHGIGYLHNILDKLQVRGILGAYPDPTSMPCHLVWLNYTVIRPVIPLIQIAWKAPFG